MKRLACTVLLLSCVAACSARGSGGGIGPVDKDGSVSDTPASGDTQPPSDTPMPPEDVPATPDLPITPDVPVVPDVPITPPDVTEGRCTSDSQCVGAQFCANGMCRPIVCTPNSITCATSTSIRTCDSRGAMSMEAPCPGGARCEANRCQSPQVCTPNARSCASPTAAQVCSPDGSMFIPMPCPVGPNGTAQCSDGTCSLACNLGFGDCDAVASNGCEAMLATDRTNCGSCGRACASGQSCVAGACMSSVVCTSPQVNCSGVCVDTTSDNANCGVCGRACATGTTCRSGTCMAGSAGGRYTRTTSTATYTNACTLTGATRLFAASTDDSFMLVAIPFQFNYWGQPVNASPMGMNVSTNGALNLLGVADSVTSGSIPSAAVPNSVVAVFWRDLVVGTNVCVATTGSVGNRRLIVTWPSMRLYGGTTSETISAEVIINEADSSIDFLYPSVTLPSGTTATIGLENQAGTMAIGGCTAGTVCSVTSSTRIRFVPSP